MKDSKTNRNSMRITDVRADDFCGFYCWSKILTDNKYQEVQKNFFQEPIVQETCLKFFGCSPAEYQKKHSQEEYPFTPLLRILELQRQKHYHILDLLDKDNTPSYDEEYSSLMKQSGTKKSPGAVSELALLTRKSIMVDSFNKFPSALFSEGSALFRANNETHSYFGTLAKSNVHVVVSKHGAILYTLNDLQDACDDIILHQHSKHWQLIHDKQKAFKESVQLGKNHPFNLPLSALEEDLIQSCLEKSAFDISSHLHEKLSCINVQLWMDAVQRKIEQTEMRTKNNKYIVEFLKECSDEQKKFFLTQAVNKNDVDLLFNLFKAGLNLPSSEKKNDDSLTQPSLLIQALSANKPSLAIIWLLILNGANPEKKFLNTDALSRLNEVYHHERKEPLLTKIDYIRLAIALHIGFLSQQLKKEQYFKNSNKKAC